MRLNKFTIGLICIVTGAIGVYALIANNIYPVAFVKGEMISASNFKAHYSAAYRYYDTVLKKYPEQAKNFKSAAEIKPEIRRGTLDVMIENIIITHALKEKVKEGLASMVASRIADNRLETDEIKNAIRALYGINVENFKQMVLEPQAEREILQQKLNEGEKKDLTTWLTEEKKKTPVVVLIPGLAWNGSSIIVK